MVFNGSKFPTPKPGTLWLVKDPGVIRVWNLTHIAHHKINGLNCYIWGPLVELFTNEPFLFLGEETIMVNEWHTTKELSDANLLLDNSNYRREIAARILYKEKILFLLYTDFDNINIWEPGSYVKTPSTQSV